MGIWMARKLNRKCKFKRRSNTVSMVTEEVYLRDDIRCGSPLCNTCVSSLPTLPADASHYLLPDAEALTQFWEVVEIPHFAGVIFLSSVLKKVQERLSQRSWRKLRSVITDKRRCNILFDDEHCIYTWLTRTDGASDYLKGVADWFVDHLNETISVVILTGVGDASLVIDSTKVLDPDTYFRGYWSHDSTVLDLFNSLVLTIAETTSKDTDGASRGSGGKSAYKEHLPAALLESEISSGALRVGIFFVSKHAPSEAVVRPSNKGEASRLEIFVTGRACQNRALHGDTVAVKTLVPDLMEIECDSAEDVMLEDEVELRQHEEEAHVAGEVVGILQRAQRDYVACLTEEDETILQTGARLERLKCIPMDKRIPLVELRTRQGQRLLNQRFILRIDKWDREARYPNGHLVRLLGSIGDVNAEVDAILTENGISTTPFSNLSLQELPEDTSDTPWRITDEEYMSRRDIRTSHRSCSIDPPGSKDVDDVLSVNYLTNGLLEVGVHIADVSYFVKEGSLLDLEAKSRGTTVYMVGKSWHMLPAILSENLCSLIGGKDRLAVSVVWTLDPQKNFEVVNTWFGRTIIRSRHQLFYAQAELIMEGKTLPSAWKIRGDEAELTELQRDLMVLARFAQCRRALRKLDGALELASTELRFEVNEKKEPVQVETKTELPMNWIVAEMMIFANFCVGERIYRFFPTSALLRKHAAPRLDSFTMLMECCEARGIVLDASSNKRLAASLDLLRDTGNPVLEHAFRALVTRAMSEAEYFSTGEEESSRFYHYGLALSYYTHFTSPIRRYADILVHRMLIASCETSSSRLTSSELQEIAEHLNERHRASKRAQKECNELYLLMYLQSQEKAERGVVLSLVSKGIVVFVPKYDLRGVVFLEDKDGQAILPEQRNGMTAGRCCLVKEKTSMRINELTTGRNIAAYRLMDTVWVRLRADGSRAHGPTLRMTLLSNDHPAVMAAEPEDVTLALSQLDILKTGSGKAAISERMKAIQAMAVTVATSSKKENPPCHSTKKKLTVADILENVSQAKASFLFEDNGVEDFNAALMNSNVSGVVVSSSLDRPAAAIPVEKESHAQLLLRRRWEQELAKAARVKAKLTTSTLPDDTERQQARAMKEKEVRESAETVMMQLCRER